MSVDPSAEPRGSLLSDPLDAVAWPVTTERLVVRRARPDDAAKTFAFRGLPEVDRWITEAAPDPTDYERRFVEPARLERILIIEHDDVVIGDLMVRIGDAWAQREVAERAVGTQAELGWTLDPAYAGRGFATEAVRATVDLCFGPLGLRRVTAECFADNEPSWRLMERIGMRREAHTVRDSLHRSGEWHDSFGYALLAEEWAGTVGTGL